LPEDFIKALFQTMGYLAKADQSAVPDDGLSGKSRRACHRR
jgi:hypothetical protein